MRRPPTSSRCRCIRSSLTRTRCGSRWKSETAWRARKPPSPSGMPERLRASVCIPTRNRARILQQTLEGLNHQSVSRDRLQVVVGDDASSDSTLAMLKAFRSNFELRWTTAEARGAGAARNAAAGIAS
ncbi:MAG: glycosyltransferase family 2 protein, partial [Chloroflexi bacterium]